MAWYFRVVELADGKWACHHGRTSFDQHSRVADAVAHMRELAAAQQPASVFLHLINGTVRCVGDYG